MFKKYTYKPKNQSEKNQKELSPVTEKKALHLAKSLEKSYSEEKVQKIEKKKNKYFNTETFKKIKDKVEYLWGKLKSHETPVGMKLAIFGGFAYMVLPIDVIPDSIPGFGLVDDAAVLAAIWKNCVPYFKEVAKDIVNEKGTEFISKKLSSMYKGTIIRAVCVLLVNITGTLIACFEPFGKIASEYTASVLFLACFIFSFVRFILFWKKNGLIVFKISREIIKAKNINTGVANFIRNSDEKEFKIISRVFEIVDVANSISDVNLPDLERFIAHFVRKFLYQLILFFVLYFIYLILFYWILKPVMLTHFAGMQPYQLLIFPFYQLFTVIFRK